MEVLILLLLAQGSQQLPAPTKPDKPVVLPNQPFNWNPGDGHVCRWMHNYYAYSIQLQAGKTYILMTSDSRAKGGIVPDPYLYLLKGRSTNAAHESHDHTEIGVDAWGDDNSGGGKTGREAAIVITPKKTEWYTIRLRSVQPSNPGTCTLSIALSKGPLANTPPLPPDHCK